MAALLGSEGTQKDNILHVKMELSKGSPTPSLKNRRTKRPNHLYSAKSFHPVLAKRVGKIHWQEFVNMAELLRDNTEAER